jgi:hypothetical protein
LNTTVLSEKKVCGILQRTIENQNELPCQREPRHKGGHNPFSANAPQGELFDAASHGHAPNPVGPAGAGPVSEMRHGTAGTEQKSVSPVWSGTATRCRLKQGHAGPHQEGVPDAFSG